MLANEATCGMMDFPAVVSSPSIIGKKLMKISVFSLLRLCPSPRHRTGRAQDSGQIEQLQRQIKQLQDDFEKTTGAPAQQIEALKEQVQRPPELGCDECGGKRIGSPGGRACVQRRVPG